MATHYDIWRGIDNITSFTTRGATREYLWNITKKNRDPLYMTVTENKKVVYAFPNYETALAWLNENGELYILIDKNSKKTLYQTDYIIAMYYEIGVTHPNVNQVKVHEYKQGRLFDRWPKETMHIIIRTYGHLTHNPFPNHD